MARLSDKIRESGDRIASAGPELLPGWLINLGVASWMFIGAVGALLIVVAFLGASSSISVPLILAMVIGMVSYPLVERLVARRIPVGAAATIVLLLLAAAIIGTGWVVSAGILAQWPSIQAELQQGLAELSAALQAAGLEPGSVRDAISAAQSATGDASGAAVGGLASSLGSALSSGLSGIFALLFGLFIAATLLFYVLTDFPSIASWIARHLGGLPEKLGVEIVDDAVSAMRGYFRATTLTGLVVATVIGLAMWAMGIPLAFSVALVTFLTCYIPFFGAIVSGAFAFLIALSSGGLTLALIVLVVVLVTQNLLQTVVNARIMGDSLDLRPMVVLVVTMLGGTFGGILGAALAAPVAALLMSAGKRLSAVDWTETPEGV